MRSSAVGSGLEPEFLLELVEEAVHLGPGLEEGVEGELALGGDEIRQESVQCVRQLELGRQQLLLDYHKRCVLLRQTLLPTPQQ